MTATEREQILTNISRGAVLVERQFGVPAELCAAQAILESGWLKNTPGNNAFGLKARPTDKKQLLQTKERFTPAQLSAFKASGKTVLSSGLLMTGKHECVVMDDFAAFDSLDECFLRYGDLMANGRYFKPRLERYKAHRSLSQLAKDMTGADGQPPYATGKDYDRIILTLAGDKHLLQAIEKAKKELAERA